jgi:hypothetical protein
VRSRAGRPGAGRSWAGERGVTQFGKSSGGWEGVEVGWPVLPARVPVWYRHASRAYRTLTGTPTGGTGRPFPFLFLFKLRYGK